MARPRLLPLLAAVLVAGSRAAGQPVPPTPATHPDPAAVLLPPVGLHDPDTGPLPPPPVGGGTGGTTAVSLKPVSGELPAEVDDRDLPLLTPARRSWQTYDYLTDRSRPRPGSDFRTGRESRAPGDELWIPDSGDRGTRGDTGGRFGDRVEGVLDRLREPGKRERGLFCTDRDFDGFITPMTNPFLFESAQTSTEIRGLFIGQGIPKGAGPFEGGSAFFAGGQARLAFGERFSVTVNKIGVTVFRPGTGSAVGNGTALSELWLGPKFVLVRNVPSQTLVTLGAVFQIPLGGASAYQDTGKLSIAPYVSVAQKLFETNWGTLNAQANAGYSIATNRDRSDYFYANGHLSWNWMNRGRFFPLVEVNWFQYTADGRERGGFGVEGRDLANIGGAVGRSGLFTGAVGARYRFGERWEVGGAFEIPFAGNKDLFRYRFSLDLIWRY